MSDLTGALRHVLPSAGAAVGNEKCPNVLGLPDSENVVVLVVDGLGYDLLTEYHSEAPYLSSLLDGPALECGVPSTTATSLTTLGTGLLPGQHGIVGYTSRIPATGERLNSLVWDADVDPLVWQPHPTVFERLRADGIDAQVVNLAKFEGSGLTVCSQRGAPYVPVASEWERLEAVCEIVESAGRSVVYSYESALDHEGHKSGPGSLKWREVLAKIDRDLQHLRSSLPSGTTLVVTADHGMIPVPENDRFDIEDVRRLRDDVALIAGEARFRHVYTRQGAAETVAETWRAELGERALVVTRDQAEAEGWFGPILDSVRERIGDVLVATLGDFALFSSADFPMEFQMAGFHGSITEPERRIPLLIDR